MEPVVRNRVAFLVVGVLAASACIAARLWQLQVDRATDLRDQARRQHESVVDVSGERGSILDRHGRVLAVSVETASLFAHPWKVGEPAAAAAMLAPILGEDVRSVEAKLRSKKPFVWLRRRLDPEAEEAVRRLGLDLGPGKAFGFETEWKRFYPQNELGVHVVGFANIDHIGVEGIERTYQDRLQGGESRYLAVRDGHGGAVLQLISPPSRQPEDVVLTLDLVLQHIVERELERAVRETGSIGGSAVLLDPATGEILALANRPTADPNRYGDATPDSRRDRALTDMIEPGSTFKIVAAAAALDRGTVTAETPFYCGEGSIVVARHRIRDHRPHGTLSVREILEQSSNVGIIKIAETLERSAFRDAIVRFGFGERTGVELPGETRGRVSPVEDWSGLSRASMSMGQEVGVSALQVASAFAAIANDGLLVPPRIVSGFRDGDDRFVPAERPEVRRVVSARTAFTLGRILEGVVTRGTGTRAAVPGYRIAGKTGTAQKIGRDGRYSHREFVSSFAGFAPVLEPRIAGVLVLDTPRRGSYYGGSTAAPAFGRIVADALTHLGVPLEEDPADLREPPSDDPEPPDVASAPSAPAGPGQVPDVLGLSLREASVRLAEHGYRVFSSGSGVVRDQAPPPGTELAEGETCRLVLGETLVASADADRTRRPR